MDEPNGPEAARADRRRFTLAGLAGLAAGAPAVFLVSTMVLGLRDTRTALREWWPQVATGYAAMVLFLLVTARPLATRMQAAPAWIAPFHVVVFTVGAGAGSLANCLWNGATDWADWFGKPLFWLLLLGSAPALCIGVFAALVYVWLERRGS